MSDRNNSDTSQIILNESPCDLNLIVYFLVSCILFATGFKITFFSQVEEDDVNSNRYWLGPLFLFSGIIVATNTLIYLRSKNSVQMMSRESESLFPQESETIQIHPNSHSNGHLNIHSNIHSTNTSSYQNLPPSYMSASYLPQNLPPSYTSTINSDNYLNLASLPIEPGSRLSTSPNLNIINFNNFCSNDNLTTNSCNAQSPTELNNQYPNLIDNPLDNSLNSESPPAYTEFSNDDIIK